MFFTIEGVDYEFLVPSIIFESGSGEATVNCTNISIFDDSVAEPVEDIQLEAISSDPRVNITAPSSITVLIVDNDVPGTKLLARQVQRATLS